MDDSHKLHIDHEYCVVFRFSVIGALMNTVLLLFVYEVLTKPLPSKNVLMQSKHIINSWPHKAINYHFERASYNGTVNAIDNSIEVIVKSQRGELIWCMQQQQNKEKKRNDGPYTYNFNSPYDTSSDSDI